MTGEPLPGILVQVSADYVPEDGDAFDAVQAALEHFEIPAFIREGTYIRRGPIEAVGDKAPPVAELPLEDQRRAAADKAFERYDFGSGTTVEDSDGWEFVSGKGPRSWRCSVFLSFGDWGFERGFSQGTARGHICGQVSCPGFGAGHAGRRARRLRRHLLIA